MAGRSKAWKRKSLALACTLAFALPAGHAAEYDGTVFFGDSLTDSGTFGAKFTTNPGAVWSELLAARLGSQALPTAYKDLIAFALLVLVLIFRPHGLLGERIGKRA